MQAFFGGNPLSTPIGQRIDKATDVSLQSEDWGLNMEITDIINETDEGPKDAIRSLRKKMSLHIGKNYKVIDLCLTIVETCVKNCGRRFHMQVANKEFLQDLIKIISPKNEAPSQIQERILGLIQAWADAFKGSPELKEVERFCQDLKSKGIEFPMTDLDKMAPIHTPAATHAPPESPPQRVASARNPSRGSSARHPSHGEQSSEGEGEERVIAPSTMAGPAAIGKPTQDQVAKLRSELDIVHGNCHVFNEMISEVDPNTGQPQDIELMGELYTTCRQMQERVVKLIGLLGEDEHLTEDLLRANDDLNNVFLRYNRFEKNKTDPSAAANMAPASQPAPVPVPVPTPAPARVSSDLINLSDDSGANGGQSNMATAAALSEHMAGLSMDSGSVSGTLSQLDTTGTRNSAKDFDMFAESRQAYSNQQQGAGGGGASELYANQEQARQHVGGLGQAVNSRSTPYDVDAKDAKVRDMQEMSAWLDSQGNVEGNGGSKTATSSEFDKFLAERARAGENLPDLPKPEEAPPIPTRGRQMQKDESENTLFAL